MLREMIVLDISNGAAVGNTKANGTEDARKSLAILAGIFVVSLFGLFYVYMIFPELDE